MDSLSGCDKRDLTITYGIRIIAPFSGRRVCFEWTFFIDSVIILMTTAALVPAVLTLRFEHDAYPAASGMFVLALMVYFVVKWWLRRRAGTMANNAVSVIPSALIPLMFFVCEQSGDSVTSSQVNVLTKKTNRLTSHTIYDEESAERLAVIPEYQAMKSLGPAYHVIERREDSDGTHILCRDMRIVNFDTTFGMLDVTFGTDDKPVSVHLHV